MTCDAYEQDLVDIVDGTVDPLRQREVERHLDACAACRTLVADLRAIQAGAMTLERLEPPARVWQRIQERLANESPAAGAAGPRPWSAPVVVWRPWLGAAAALLLATAIGVYSLVGRNTAPGGSQQATGGSATVTPAPATEELVASVEADLQAAEAHYEKAILGLEQIARTDNDALDPQVAAVLQKNLSLIDQAIEESRAAVRAQPASVNAQESLFDAMRNKVALLQQTVELINEMRKGNQAEAGRLLQGLPQP
jgi:anti-sigma factor RsiW